MKTECPSCKTPNGLLPYEEVEDYFKCYNCGFEVYKGICPSCKRRALTVIAMNERGVPTMVHCKACQWEGPRPNNSETRDT